MRSSVQQGTGVGSFLRGIYRTVLPHLKRGGRTIGQEALHAGMNVLSDVASRNIPIQEAIRNRTRESGGKLKRKAKEKLDRVLSGSGYKMSRNALLGQSDTSFDTVNTLQKTEENQKSKKRKKITKNTNITPSINTKKKKKKIKPRSVRDIFG